MNISKPMNISDEIGASIINSGSKVLRSAEKRTKRNNSPIVIDLDNSRQRHDILKSTQSDHCPLAQKTVVSQSELLSTPNGRWTRSMQSIQIQDNDHQPNHQISQQNQCFGDRSFKPTNIETEQICIIDEHTIQSSAKIDQFRPKGLKKKRGAFAVERHNLNLQPDSKISQDFSQGRTLRSFNKPKQCISLKIPQIICLEDDRPPPNKMSFSIASGQQLAKHRKNKAKPTRKTRQSCSALLFPELEEWERKIRFKVAKYRYSIPKCNQTIEFLALTTNSKIHLGPMEATVPKEPIIKRQSRKHKVFVESLRVQLKKRRFVYID